jgi:hypothetical protein
VSLDERYGRRPARDRRPLLLAALGVFVAAAVVWAVWSIITLTRSTLSWRDVDVDTSDPAVVRVTFEVSQATDRAALCAVRATDAAGAVVGWADVPVGPSPAGTAEAQARVRTVRPAAGGGVVTCVRR